MSIELVFLGTGQAIPTARRNHTAVLLRYEDELILFDCGEGTQRQFRKAEINPCKLTRLLISHWHGDHVLGIPGLLQTLALNGYNKTLYVYGPKRTEQFISLMYKLFVFEGKIKINIREVSKGKILEAEKFYIETMPLKHGTFCNAYVFVEKDKRRIDKAKLKKLNLPSSPLLAKSKQGKDIEYKGKTIKAKDITYIEKGRKICVILDTAITENAVKIAKNSDLLICEATYTEKEKDRATEYKHLTSAQAATIAKKAKVKKLILTHLSQRYENKEKEVLSEARKVFKNTEIAEDLMRVKV